MADAMRDLYGIEALPVPSSRASSLEMISSETTTTETR
jgi:hypothetical protein